MYRRIRAAAAVLAAMIAGWTPTSIQAEELFRVDETIEIAPVWAGHPVDFHLLTVPPRQFVAYYSADREMTVAARFLGARHWDTVVLPEQVGWDSHNAIVFDIDDDGHIHLTGNMHVHPLKYFRTARPMDIHSFERIPAMIGRDEEKVTYPQFFRGPDNAFILTYRDGRSGAGRQIYNVYDHATQTWRRLLDEPLTDGGGLRNAYFDGPRKGPDGYYHLAWVWRDSPDCATNHSLSYARSRDLVYWENSQGEPCRLPITLDTGEVIDPVPPGGGIINGNVRIGFDVRQRPVVAYHKYDDAGATQIYNARLEDGIWNIYQTTDWGYRWEFSGNGSIVFEIRIQPVRIGQDGALTQQWTHVRHGAEHWRLSPETLQAVEQLPMPPAAIPSALRSPESGFPGIEPRFQTDSGRAEAPGVRYLLRWETLGHNRDRPRPEPWPGPSMLRVYRLVRTDAPAAD